MRGTAWPNGFIRQYQQYLNENRNYNENLPTISGVLQVRETVFGHKWIYKLNETRNDTELQFQNKFGCGFLIRIISATAVLILVIFGVIFTVLGPKYLNSLNNSLHQSNNWSYKFEYPKTQQKTRIIFYRNNRTIDLNLNLTNLVELSENKTNFNKSEQIQIKFDTNIIMGCSQCAQNEICLQNTSKMHPECTVINDRNDPTGCAGLCELEIQYCKKLDDNFKIFSCIDIGTLTCPKNYWKCDQTLMCIGNEKKCDGIIHCSDKSDEINCECNLENNFRCGQNVSCIPKSKFCDGSVDCWDAFDEKNCTHECDVGKTPCYNGQCIESKQYCDGFFDCHDKSDEPFGCLNITNLQ